MTIPPRSSTPTDSSLRGIIEVFIKTLDETPKENDVWKYYNTSCLLFELLEMFKLVDDLAEGKMSGYKMLHGVLVNHYLTILVGRPVSPEIMSYLPTHVTFQYRRTSPNAIIRTYTYGDMMAVAAIVAEMHENALQ